MYKKESKLINNIYYLVQGLYCKYYKREVDKCGILGISGPSSNQKELWTQDIGMLQSIILMLEKIRRRRIWKR